MHERAELPNLAGLLTRQLAYQIRLLVRTPRAVVGGLLLPVLLLALRGADSAGDLRTVTGLAVLGLLSTAYVTHASGLVAAREAGVLKRWRAAPLPAWCFFAGRLGATVLVAAAGGLVTLLAAAAFDDIDLRAGSVASLALVLVVGAATWASIGTAASALIPSVEAAWPLLGLTYLPLAVLSGNFGPISGQPGWLATLIAYLPAQPLVACGRRALEGRAPFSAHDLTVELAWLAIGLLIAQRRFGWAPRPPGGRRASARRCT